MESIGPRPSDPSDERTMRHTLLDIAMPFFKWTPEDAMALDMVACTLLSTRWSKSIENVFSLINGPPGCGKTEILRGLSGWPWVVNMDNLTENALISGYRDKDNKDDDPSVLAILQKNPGTCMLCLDLTTHLENSKDRVLKFMGQLRRIYDGDLIESHSGSIGRVKYKIKRTGMIAATTRVYELYMEHLQAMGQRFIAVRMATDRGNWGPPEWEEQTRKARQLFGVKKAWRANFKAKLQNSLNVMVDQTLEPRTDVGVDAFISMPQDDVCVSLAYLVAAFRTAPLKGRPTDMESPTRLDAQFRQLGIAHCAYMNHMCWNEDQVTMIRRIARDTLPSLNLGVLQTLASSPMGLPLGKISELICYPEKDIRNCMAQWQLLKLVKKSEFGSYRLTPDAFERIKFTGLVSGPFALPLQNFYPSLIDEGGGYNGDIIEDDDEESYVSSDDDSNYINKEGD